MARKDAENALNAMGEIARFIEEASRIIDEEEVSNFIDLLAEVYGDPRRKVLVMGAGRSGLVGKAFAMRLLHLGYNSYVLGDTIVPSVRRGDVVVAISGSGKTKLIVTAAEAAKQVGATVVAITTYPDSPLGKLADLVVKVPGRTKLAGSTTTSPGRSSAYTSPSHPSGPSSRTQPWYS